VGIDVGLATFATRSAGETIANPRFFRREERALARAQRQHRSALDAHKAIRAAVTARVQQAHPALGATDLWQAVRQDIEERATWNHRQKRRKVVARTHERGGSARTLRISTVAASSTRVMSSCSKSSA